jgi:hypothetical protein
MVSPIFTDRARHVSPVRRIRPIADTPHEPGKELPLDEIHPITTILAPAARSAHCVPQHRVYAFVIGIIAYNDAVVREEGRANLSDKFGLTQKNVDIIM